MMDSYQKINQIFLSVILDRLGVGYKKICDNTIMVKEWDKKTDGWVLNIIENYINDFTKDRAKWPPFSFLKSYLWLNDKETFDWFKDNFGIDGNYDKTKTKTKTKQKNKRQKRIKYCSDW